MNQLEKHYQVYRAAANPQQAGALLNYDHHRVRWNNQLAVLLTYHLLPLATQTEPLFIKLVLEYADKHPAAPPAVQAIIDQLTFKPEQE